MIKWVTIVVKFSPSSLNADLVLVEQVIGNNINNDAIENIPLYQYFQPTLLWISNF